MAITKAKLIADGVITVDNLHASHGITTTHIGEGEKLFYTDARVSSYLTSNNYTTSAGGYFYDATLSANILTFSKSDGTTDSVDLSLYLDDTNLARLVSGALDGQTGIATFTRDDSSTFTIDFSAFLSDANDYVSSGSFNTTTGVLTLTRLGGGTVTVDLDGKYAEASHTHLWAHITDRPTALSAFTNDLGNYGGFLTSFTETDPVYVASSWYTTTNNASNWNTAFGWGDHADSGYQAAATAITTSNISSQSVNYANTAGSTSYLSALGAYVWNASTNGRDFNIGIQTSFVGAGESYPNYGSVIRVRSFANSQDGGTAELYFPYSSDYGGSSMRYRLGQYDNAGWTGWKTVIDSDNIGSQSVSYATSAGNSTTTDQRSFNYLYGSSYLESGGAVYGTIFYDNNDRGYYLDPNGFSNLHSATFNANWGGSSPHQGAINIRGDYPSMMFRNFASNTAWLRHMDASGNIQHYYIPDGYDSSNWSIRHTMQGDGTFYSASSMRAPIFYDSNDTGYYVDPAGTSNLNGLNVGGNAVITAGNIGSQSVSYASSAGSSHGIGYDGNAISGMGPISNWDSRPGVGQAGFGINWHTGVTISGYAGYGGVRLYASGYPTHADSVLRLEASGAVYTYGGLYSDGNAVIHAGNIGSQSVSYATSAGSAIDSSKLPLTGGVLTSGGGYPLQSSSTQRYIYQASNTSNSINSNYGWWWFMDSDFTMGFHADGAGDKLSLTRDGVATAENSFRAPIFYDSNDTNYYVDPHGLSSQSSIIIGRSGTTHAYDGAATGKIYFGSGIVGSDASTYYHITTNLENFGGNYSKLDFVWYTGQRFYAHNSYGGFRFKEITGSQATLFSIGEGDSNVRVSNTLYVNGDTRSPIFYDSNDTGYYLNPNSTSNLNELILYGLTVSGTITGSVNGNSQTSNHLNTTRDTPSNSLQYWQQSGLGINEAPSGDWHNTIRMGHGSPLSYYSNTLAIRMTGSGPGDIYTQTIQGGSMQGWKKHWNDGNMDAPNKSGTSYYQTNTWMQFNGNHGLYWPSYYGAHFYPNNGGSYTQFRLDGSKNNYSGIWDSHSSVNGIMYDSAGNGGIYREANGRWYFYHLVANNCTGINTSTTSASYGLYVEKGIYSTGDIVAYSDVRKKTNIVTIDSALDKVTSLRGVYYDRIDDLERGRQTGVIAQEVNEVLPEAVTYAEDIDEYGVKYGNIVGVLIEAIKEQQKQIEELKAIVNGITK